MLVKNGIAVHAWTQQHGMDWQNATVKQVETSIEREEQLKPSTSPNSG